MRILIALVAWTAVCLPGEALAWGQEGHSIVAEIAQRRLSPDAEAAVRAVLGTGSLAAVSTWADDVRAARPSTTKWHFADIPIDKNDFNPERDCKPNPTKGDCVVAELERLRTELRRGSRQQRLEALMFVVHFVGDIHQPLHTVADKDGGNGIDVTITAAGFTCVTGCPPEFKTLKTNFHRAWDSDLIHRTVFSWGTYVDRLEAGWLKTAEARKIGLDGGKPADWVVETHKYAQTVWHALGADDVIDDKYFDQALPVLDRQLAVAGLRLARFLNETFAEPGAPAPPAAAEMALGCDKISGPTPAGGAPPPAEDYLTAPQNLALFKQQLLIYRCKRYDAEIAMIVQEAEAWINLRAAQVSNPAIVLDIDDTSLSNWKRIYQDEYYPFPSPCTFTQKCSDKDWQWTEQAPAVEAVLNLYNVAQCLGVASPCSKIDVYFVSGRHEGDKYVPKQVCDPSHDKCDPSLLKSPREWTLGNLQKAGFTGVTNDHLYLRPASTPGSTEPPVSAYKTDQRIKIEQLGKTIIANLGDQQSDLVGLHAERAFKLPNPFYFVP